MWTRRQAYAFKLIGQTYSFLYEVPFKWDPGNFQIFILSSDRKWKYWYSGLESVAFLWFTCVYTLFTQPIFRRKGFGVLEFCVLTTGFCAFTATLAMAEGLLSNLVETIKGANELIALDRHLIRSMIKKDLWSISNFYEEFIYF